ncbi:hypothetical protein BOTBODRAFT_170460 [Botryobasidium botryosum FD-172 SS1]|uniref:TOM13-domain-containing protein n=1 Tax=Botryobasidium botryosum (strain FD-172 SS1) TaxID=930990 RepID=A0A067MXF8_BOTB1|nr:hypothetical protein BOTBODRAFT_170460 [Botryobasidium botryosum FD-172 SS1]
MSDSVDASLEAALHTAFADTNIPAQPAVQPTPEEAAQAPVPVLGGAPTPAPIPTPSGEPSAPLEESWKDEYSELESSWRAESAAMRAKAEKERERWAAVREAEEAAAAEQKKSAEGGEVEWETVSTSPQAPKGSFGSSPHSPSAATSQHLGEPSIVDVRDLVEGEHQGHPTQGPDSEDGLSRTWEDVPSMASSFPSLPENNTPPSAPSEKEKRPSSHLADNDKDDKPTPVPLPPSLTMTLFDSNAPARTRILALFSTLAINLVLPFVNGVMLGFGEIFARNVVGPWFGWNTPARAPLDRVGLRSAGGGKRFFK